jgi:DNA-directed RNA polymerase subunit RPC12/RpoP
MAEMFQSIGRSIQPGERLHIRCGLCGRQVAWSRAMAVDQLGAKARPADVARKLRCSECGSRKITVWI